MTTIQGTTGLFLASQHLKQQNEEEEGEARAFQKEIITERFQRLLILTIGMSRGHSESHLMFCLLFLL